MNAEKLLRVLLILGGAGLATAFLFILMPTSAMAANHEWLGLGTFPEAPLTDYLTRSIAGLYGLRGILLLFAASNVRRNLSLIRLIGATDILFGTLLIGIDLHAGMPLWWFLLEGPVLIPLGTLVLWLTTRIPEK